MTPKQKLIQKLQEFVVGDREIQIDDWDETNLVAFNHYCYNQALAELRDKIPNLVDEILNITNDNN